MARLIFETCTPRQDVASGATQDEQIAADLTQIVQIIGSPRGFFPFSQVTIYLATAPKSNAVLRAYTAAVQDATSTAREPVPLHLRNAVTPLMKNVGYGEGYR